MAVEIGSLVELPPDDDADPSQLAKQIFQRFHAVLESHIALR